MKALSPQIFVLLCSFLCTAALADPTGQARTSLQAQYARMDQAMEAGDASVYAQVCTPDCRFRQPGQPPITVEQLAKMMAQLMPQWKDMKTHTVITTLTVTGNTTVVTNTQTTDGLFNGQTLHDVTTNKDTWKNTPQGWRLSLSRVLADKMTPGPLPPNDPALVQTLVAQIKTNAVPLATTDPAAGLDDLAPLGADVGEAIVVALGEASHGTREFFQMKHRLLEYLVEKKGFTVFAMEANWPETQAVDHYIKTGQGDPRAALAGLYFWTWDTQEVLDLIEWMRAYNAAPGPHATLSFSGFDMQTPDVALTNVIAYLGGIRPSERAAIEKDYAPLRRLIAAHNLLGIPLLGSKAAACRAGTDAALRRLDAHRAEYMKSSSSAEFEDARQNAVIVRQATEEMMLSFQEGGAYRDKAMAGNVEWLTGKKYPGQKIVLWAHNGHVGVSGGSAPKSMGTYLRAAYGPALYSLGFAFGGGEIRAVPMSGGQMKGAAVPLPVPAAAAGTGDALLHLVGLPLFLLDFRGVDPGGALGQWLGSPHPFRMPGAAWDPSAAVLFSQPVTLRSAFDALVYVDISHASRELSFPERAATAGH